MGLNVFTKKNRLKNIQIVNWMMVLHVDVGCFHCGFQCSSFSLSLSRLCWRYIDIAWLCSSDCTHTHTHMSTMSTYKEMLRPRCILEIICQCKLSYQKNKFTNERETYLRHFKFNQNTVISINIVFWATCVVFSSHQRHTLNVLWSKYDKHI